MSDLRPRRPTRICNRKPTNANDSLHERGAGKLNMPRTAFRPPRRWRNTCCVRLERQQWVWAEHLSGLCCAADVRISARQISFFVPETKTLLHRDRAEHVIGVQCQRTAPERGLEDMARLLARAALAGLHQKPRPFQGQKNATGKRSHLAPAGRVPILWLSIEGFEQGGLGRAVVGLDIGRSSKRA